MRDQAESLRMHLLQSQGKLGRSIAVVSGKGGVGKSNLSINFSSVLSEIGKRVIIVDMDVGMGNIHILLGENTKYNLPDYLENRCELDELIAHTPNRIHFVAGGSGLNSVVNWTNDEVERLMLAFEFFQKQYDYILFDMGAGASNQTLEFLTAMDDIFVITTTEPTAITDAYSMMKFITLKDKEKDFFIICNRANTETEGQESNTRMKYAMKKFLNVEIVALGSIPEDLHVHKAVKAQQPYTLLYPNAEVTHAMRKIVNRYLDEKVELQPLQKSENTFISKMKLMFSRGRV